MTLLPVLYAVFVSSSFVLILYVLPSCRPTESISRNDPHVIKVRLQKISLICLFHLLTIPFILTNLGIADDWQSAFASLGVLPGMNYKGEFSFSNVVQSLQDCMNILFLIGILFCGPLTQYFLIENNKSEIQSDFKALLNLVGLRNYIVAPATEEFVYTACVLATLRPCGIQIQLYVSPLLFGFAHVHHGYELFKGKQHSMAAIMVSCIFQLCYTWLFGILTNYMFLRTNNLLGCILAHSFCNWNGFPDLVVYGQKWWRVTYYALLILGAVGFFSNLHPLTDSCMGYLK